MNSKLVVSLQHQSDKTLSKMTHIKHIISSFFKHKIGTNYQTKEHQYYSHFTGRTWFEKY